MCGGMEGNYLRDIKDMKMIILGAMGRHSADGIDVFLRMAKYGHHPLPQTQPI